MPFQVEDIPPTNRDPQTHMVLHALLSELQKHKKNQPICPPSKSHNETNRMMYQIYSDSQFPVHENNFAMNCKPHLRNLPAETAVELQTLRSKLDMERPPYKPIQMDLLPEPTVPTFSKVTNNPKFTALKPREKWMRDTPPFLSDAEADETYSAACAWLFGTGEPPRGPAYPRDPRHPSHPHHMETVGIRERISKALSNQEYIKDFPRKYIP